MKEPQLRLPCAWFDWCNEPAHRLRWHEWAGEYRPACKRHTADATPIELKPLPAPIP